MTMYEHPYRLDAVFVQHLSERLHGVSSTSPNHIPSDPGETPVFLLSVEDLTSLPDTFSTLRHIINSLNQMAFICFPAEHDVKVDSLYTPP